MHRDEAVRIAERVKAVWGGQMTGAQAQVWTDHLVDRDGPTAWRVLRALETSEPRRPSIAAFVEAYAAEYRRGHTDAERQLARADCPWCFGEGWERVSYDGHGTVRRCREKCPIPRDDLATVEMSPEQKARNLDRLHTMMADLRAGTTAPLPARRPPVAAPLPERDPSGPS